MDSQSSQISTVGSSMQSLMSAGSVFTGTGTILGPLIEMTGPGIMSTLIQLIGNIILNYLIMPMLNQFTASILGNDLNTITSPLGGINQTILQGITISNQATSITEQSGATKQSYGSGTTSESTATQDYIEGKSIRLDNMQIPSSSGSNSGTEMSGLLGSLYSFSTTLAIATFNDNGMGFGSLTNLIGVIINGFNTLISSTFNTSIVTIIDIGLLSTINDLLGLGKTFVDGTPGAKVLIQRIRLVIDGYQTLLSALNLKFNPSNDLYNAFIGTFWFIKSGSSILSDLFSYINDLATIDSGFFSTVISFLFAHSPDLLFGWALSGATSISLVNGFSLIGRMVLAATSAFIIFANFFLKDILAPLINVNPWLSPLQFGATLLITTALAGEAIAKLVLYFNRFDGKIDDKKDEQLIYGTSVILDLAQLGGTLLGMVKM